MKPSMLRSLKFSAVLLPFALVAGVSIGFYEWTTGIASAVDAVMTQSQFVILVTAQTILYAIITGFFGCLLAEKIGLLRSFAFCKKPLIRSFVAGLLAGIGFFILEYAVFSPLIPDVALFYENKSFSAVYLVSEIFYGGVIEETMLRLFFMSLLAFLLWKIFARKYPKENIPTILFIVANIIAAFSFAAGHLPATYTMYGEINSLILLRCFLINGGLGLLFGFLYRRYGIQYAMVTHGLTHVVNDSIFFLVSFL